MTFSPVVLVALDALGDGPGAASPDCGIGVGGKNSGAPTVTSDNEHGLGAKVSTSDLSYGSGVCLDTPVSSNDSFKITFSSSEVHDAATRSLYTIFGRRVLGVFLLAPLVTVSAGDAGVVAVAAGVSVAAAAGMSVVVCCGVGGGGASCCSIAVVGVGVGGAGCFLALGFAADFIVFLR